VRGRHQKITNGDDVIKIVLLNENEVQEVGLFSEQLYTHKKMQFYSVKCAVGKWTISLKSVIFLVLK